MHAAWPTELDRMDPAARAAYDAEFARKDRALMAALPAKHAAAGRDYAEQFRIAEQYRADLEALDAAYLAGRDLP